MSQGAYEYDAVGAGGDSAGAAGQKVASVNQQRYRMEEGKRWRQYAVASVANFGILVTGIAMGWTSPIQSKLEDSTTSPLSEPVTTDQFAWIASLVALGAAFGPLFGVLMADRLGRKWSILLADVPMIIGWILVAAASSVWMLYVARIMWGISVGVLFMITPMYVGEIAEKEVRGALGSFLQIFVVVGYLVIYAVGPFVSYLVVAILGIAATIAAFACFFFMPETPTHLLAKGDKSAALKSLMILRGKSEFGVQQELDTLEAEVRATQELQGSFTEIFTVKGNVKALYISCTLVGLQQLSGINVVLFYLQDIFKRTGTDMSPSTATIVVGVVQVLASCVTPFVVDRLGRRLLLMTSSVGMTIGLGLLGLFFLLDEQKSPVVSSITWLPVTSLIVYMLVYCTGYGPLPWAVMGELFASNVKAKGSLITTAFCWILGFIITRFFSDLEKAIGMYFAFWIFCIFCILGFFFVMFLVPETKGKSLQEIQDLLNNRKTSKMAY